MCFKELRIVFISPANLLKNCNCGCIFVAIKFISLVVMQSVSWEDFASHRHSCIFRWFFACGSLLEIYSLNVFVIFDIMLDLEISNDDRSSKIGLGSKSMISLPRF